MQKSAIVMQPVQQFDSNDPDYRCCSGTCHVTLGARLVGFAQAIFVVTSLVDSFIKIGQHGFSGLVGATIMSDITMGVVIGLMLYGLHKERPAFMMPHLVVLVTWMISVLVFVGVVVVAMAVDSGRFRACAKFWAVFIGSLLVRVVVKACFFSVILDAYTFLNDQQMCGPKEGNKAVVKKSGVPPPYSAC